MKYFLFLTGLLGTRLPLLDDIEIRAYALDFTIDISTSEIRGNANIALRGIRNASQLVLNSVDLVDYRITVGNVSVPFELDNEEEIIILYYPFTAGEEYSVSLNYKASFVGTGFHLNNNRSIAYTHFEPHSARSVFPCRDEPKYRAIYSASILSPATHTVLFNTGIKQSVFIENGLWKRTDYYDTIPLPSYLIAIYIESHASGLHSEVVLDGITVSVYSPRSSYALEIVTKSLFYLTNEIGVPLPVSKIDLVPVANFTAEGMENFSLITVVDSALLITEKSSTDLIRYSAQLLAHEIAHAWFGGLVTMDSFQDLFLNEGFAEYLQYVAVGYALPHLNIMDWFFTEEHDPALYFGTEFV